MTADEGQQLHEELIDLLAAYVDGEADDSERARIEAHLLGCASCRTLHGRQVAVARRLSREPVEALSPAFQARLTSALAASARSARLPGTRWWTRLPLRPPVMAWAGWAVAAALAGVLVLGEWVSRGREAAVPMVDAAVLDYRSTMSREVAFSAPDLEALSSQVGFPVTRLSDARFQLLGGWVSTIRDTPAAVLAYRWGDRIVLQYLVTPELFFRQTVVRDAVRNGGRYLTQARAHAVLAWAQGASGSLLVTDAPLQELERLQL